MTQPGYVSTTLTPAGRDALRRLTAAVTGFTGQRVSMSDALRIAERIVMDNTTAVTDAARQLGIIDPTEDQ